MSNNRLQLDGLAELREALRNLPAELTGEGSNIVEGEANGAALDIKSGYAAHRRTGKLQDSVEVTHGTSGFSASAMIIAKSPHAHLFENGTQARHTAIGANRGSMPPGHVFIPAMIRRRRRMYDALKALLERAGLVVGGDA